MSSDTEKENCLVKNKGFILEPPDGGWGYVICVAVTIIFLAITMFFSSFEVIFKEFLTKQNMDSTSVTLLNGMNMMLIAFSGYLASPLLKLTTLRKVLLGAATVFNIGVLSVVFVNSKALFFICQGVQYLGFGILCNVNFTLINEYFVKKRLLVSSIVQTVTAAGSMLAPYLVKWAQDSFGYRGTLLMISGVSLQTFVAAALIQPVERHLIRVEVEQDVEEMKLFLKEKPPVDNAVTTPTITVTEINIENGKKHEEKQNCINVFVDTTLLKKFLLSNASMGPSYCCFADLVFTLMLPAALFDLGWNNSQVTLAISLASFGDLLTRIAFVFANKWLLKIGNQEIYLAAIAVAFLSRMLMLWSENTFAIMVFITMIGISRSSLNILPPLILADVFPKDKFSSALGFFFIISGLMNLILGPAVGAIRDLTSSYSTPFYVITSCYAVVLLLWTIELVYKRSKNKRLMQMEAAEKIKKNGKKK